MNWKLSLVFTCLVCNLAACGNQQTFDSSLADDSSEKAGVKIPVQPADAMISCVAVFPDGSVSVGRFFPAIREACPGYLYDLQANNPWVRLKFSMRIGQQEIAISPTELSNQTVHTMRTSCLKKESANPNYITVNGQQYFMSYRTLRSIGANIFAQNETEAQELCRTFCQVQKRATEATTDGYADPNNSTFGEDATCEVSVNYRTSSTSAREGFTRILEF